MCRLPPEIKDFCLDTFLPEIRTATSQFRPLSEEEDAKFIGNLFGTLIKLGYGGIWEVIRIINVPFTYNKIHIKYHGMSSFLTCL